MAKTIVSQPSAIFPAYNPAPLVIGASNSEADVEMHLVIDGVSVTHHKREFFSLAEPLTDNFGNPITDNDGMPIPIGGDPVAVFDLGKIARNYFSNALVEINAVENATSAHVPAYIDRRLCVPFTAEITGVSSPEFVAVNAALGVGILESSFSALYDTFLTEFSSFKYYQGFSSKSSMAILVGPSNDSARVEFVGYIAPSVDLFIDSATVLQTWADAEDLTLTFSDVSVFVSLAPENAVDPEYVMLMLFARINQETAYSATTVTEGGVSYLHIAAPAGTHFLAMPILSMEKVRYGYRVTPNLTQSNMDSSIGDGSGKVIAVNVPPLGEGFLWGYLSVDLLNEETLLDSRLMSFECLPSSPFYVRWVNRIGGREHWMFSRRQTDKTDVDDSVTYDPRIETNADLGRFPRQISLTASHTVTVGAEGIPNAEFDVLRRITTSPLIEYYDEEITEWRVVTVKSGATSKDTASPVQSIELEFSLPSPALQF